jgi:signal peptidase II
VLFFLLLGIDQLSKYTVRQLDGFYICNPNIAFGLTIPENIFWVFWIVAILIILFFTYKKLRSWEIFLWLAILAGAISNFIDRIFMGCVLDFIDLKIWPTFNLADCFIALGAVILIFKNWRIKK